MSFQVVRLNTQSKFLSLSGLKMFSFKENKLLVLWYKSDATIFLVTTPLESLTEYHGVLKCADRIKDVILIQSSLLCLSVNGVVYIADLNGIRKEWKTVEHRELRGAKNVMAISKISEGFVVITEMGELIAYRLSYADTGRSRISHKMTRTIPNHMVGGYKDCCVVACSPHDFHSSLASFLFRDVALLKCDILFIAVGNGHVCWLPVINNLDDCNFNWIHSSNSPVVSIVFAADGKTEQNNLILIISSNGSVAVVSQVERQLRCNVHHLPSLIKIACLASPNAIFHSDGLNLWCSVLRILEKDENVSLKTHLLQIKGVNSLCAEIGTQKVVVGCRHCILYRVDSSTVGLIQDPETLATISETSDESKAMLSEWHNTTQQLCILKDMISIENKALNEISIATRAEILKHMIKLKAEVSDDFPFALANTIALKVINESQQEFSNDFWSFHIEVNCGEWNTCVTEKLASCFKPNGSLVFIVPMDVVALKLPVTVDCSLVLAISQCHNSDNNVHQFYIIPLHQVSLDVSYFLFPILEELSVNHQSFHSEADCWQQFLARFKHISSSKDTPKKADSQLLHCYSLKLPETKSWPVFIEQMIRKLDRVPQSNVKNVNKVKCRVRDSIIYFTYHSENHAVNVMTSNKYILCEIKDFAIKNIQCDTSVSIGVTSVCVDQMHLLKFRNIKLALELEVDKGTTWRNLNGLKKELRNIFDVQLPS